MTQEPEPLNPNTPSPLPQQDASAGTSADAPSATVESAPPSIEPSYAPTGEERKARRASLASRTTPKFVAAKDDAESPQSPLVSVIVTVQDAAETVRFCVDSILRQSYANLEVILVDDGSLDDGPAILDEYAKRDDRVTTIFLKDGGRVVSSEKTSESAAGTASEVAAEPDAAIPGIPPVVIERSEADQAADRDAERGDVAARARNAGLDAAHGEYVAFVGSDGVLDRRTIELLLHALIKTGADMAKSRRERFTADQLYAVAEAAAEGAHEPESVTVFTDALEAYQSVFLKSLRVLGDEFGHNTEARFLSDEDWGRLYRMSVWNGVRLPEGIYSPELLAAGELYSRMNKVVDVDVVLYRWLADGERGATHGDDGDGYGSGEGITPGTAGTLSGDATDAGDNVGPGVVVSDEHAEDDHAEDDRTAKTEGTRHPYPHDNGTPVPPVASDGGTDDVSASDASGRRARHGLTAPDMAIGSEAVDHRASTAASEAAPRRFRYWHDTFTAGSANFRFAHERGILPARSYTTMVTAYEGAKTAPDFDEPESQRQFALDTAELEELRGMLTLTQRLQCTGVRRMRLFEEGVKRFLPSALSRSQYTPGPEESE